MKVYLVQSTPNAKELLVFSKRTRHMTGIAGWDEIEAMPNKDLDEELEYVFGTIGSSWEFVDYTFLITDVTRAFTHQLVRHRVGVAFAQQAQRVGTQEDFGYMVPPEIELNKEQFEMYVRTMEDINRGYKKLVDLGARPQDARGVLPTNIHTNILMKVNLRALSDMLAVRLCVRAQGEFQNVAREMRKLVLDVHPWAKPVLAVHCVRYNVCKFPRYDKCPISQKYPNLRNNQTWYVEKMWSHLAGYDPQPETTKDWSNGGAYHHDGKESDKFP